MPTYQYACTACGERLEAVQSFSDAALTECPACEGRLRKVFSAVGVVFKGSGFYRNDSRPAAKGEGGDKGGPDKGGPEKGAGDKGGADKAIGDKKSEPVKAGGGSGSSSSPSGPAGPTGPAAKPSTPRTSPAPAAKSA